MTFGIRTRHPSVQIATAERDAAAGGRRFTPEHAARVLHRAVAIESDRIDRVADEMTLAELIALGDEVGLSERDVRAAAALEPPGAPSGRPGVVLRLAGARVAEDRRIVDGDPRRTARLVEEWVRVAHCMRARVRDGEVVRWEPAGGLIGSVRRGARQMAGEVVLDGITGITTRVVPIDDQRSAVSVEFDPGSRDQAVTRAAVGAGALGALGVVGGVLLTPLALIAVPVGFAVAGGVFAARRRTLATAQREIERLLGAVANGERPPKAMDAVRGRVRSR